MAPKQRTPGVIQIMLRQHGTKEEGKIQEEKEKEKSKQIPRARNDLDIVDSCQKSGSRNGRCSTRHVFCSPQRFLSLYDDSRHQCEYAFRDGVILITVLILEHMMIRCL